MKVTINKTFIITSGYGATDSSHQTPHTGIDLALSYGTDVLSPVSGYVSRVVDYGTQNIGKGVMIKLQNGQELIFGHLSRNDIVHVGDKVYVGMKIAESGSSGRSTGPHLHLGLKNVDGSFADPSFYERMFQKIYNLVHSGGVPFQVTPHDITITDYLNQIYLNADHQAIIHGVQQTLQTLFN